MPTSKQNSTAPAQPSEMTLQDALKTIQDLSARLATIEQEKNRVIEEQLAEIKEMKAQEEGWLVTTPNPVYNEATLDVQFQNGLAFIPARRKFPRYEWEPMKPTSRVKYLDSFKLPEERKAAEAKLNEREAMTGAQRVVELLEHDYHYQVEWFGADKLNEIKQKVQDRAREAALEQRRLNELAQANERLILPRQMAVK